MQIVIDIDEEEYNCVKITGNIGNKTAIANAIDNGTVLPKHGRVIDVDAAEKKYGDRVAFLNGRVYGEYINASTILEATKENEK